MTYEAHRGQYGLAEKIKMTKNEDGELVARKVIGTARIIRDTLPNATYIGFTGTPISREDRNTREVFGIDNMNSDNLIDFMRRLITDSKKKVFLILDNLRVHHSTKVTEWVEKHKDRIELFYLPPYAPEYNPDELVNSDLKRFVGQKVSPHSADELEKNVRSHLRNLQNHPSKVTAFFCAPFTSYAA